MPSLRNLAGAAADVSLNWILRNYVGFQPRRPNELIIPRFVELEREPTKYLEVLDRHFRLRTLRRPVVLCDEVTWRIAGERLFAELDDAGLAPRRVLVASNRFSEVRRIVRELSRPPRIWSADPSPLQRRLFAPKLCSMLFGVGGGSVIDATKLAARQLHVPCISIPTSLANDGIASPFAVIDPDHDPRGPAQVTVRTNTPLGVIVQLANFESSRQAPSEFVRSMVRSGIGDIVSNVTAVLDWELAWRAGRDRLDYPALLQARSAGEVILRRVAEGDGLYSGNFLLTLAAALVSSGEAMTRVGSSRPASGFEHKLYHAYRNMLRIPTSASHGVLVAVGTLISTRAHGRYEDEVRRVFELTGLPLDRKSLEDADLDLDQLEKAIGVAAEIKPDRYTILEEMGPEVLAGHCRDLFG